MGAKLIGRLSDRNVIQWREKRKGVWYPEDRLRAALLPFALLAPIPLLVYGLVNQYVDGPVGLAICLLCLFISGMGVCVALRWMCTSTLNYFFPTCL